ncbi:MAG TPA: hypothetical protein VFG55_03635 [Rhodanobacteraceae bacterium]|nr:hypothetical protein [Rhodanobacteraceae bacterium]
MLRMLRGPILLSIMVLTGCSGLAARADPGPVPAAGGPFAGVDTSCRSDADCAVKDVGNCCGYYPACVNRHSPTFPDRVKAECGRQGMVGICGFPVIHGCLCVQGQCSNVERGGGER